MGLHCLSTRLLKQLSRRQKQTNSVMINSTVGSQNDLELDFKVFFFVDSCR